MRAAVAFLFILHITLIKCYDVKLQTISPQMIKISNNLAPIKGGCVVLYSKCDFEGEKKEICGSISDLRKIKFDNKISSILIGKNTRIILRQLYEFKGVGLELSSNIRCFENKLAHWKNNISSLYIH